MPHPVVDLYALRCAVAALVDARHRIEDLVDGDVARIDVAVRHLIDVAADLRGDLAAATTALLSVDADPGGRRTVSAVDRLGALTHVDRAAAPALADGLRRSGPRQPCLFDSVTASPEAAT